MQMVKTDIDKLLEETNEFGEDVNHFILWEIEIDQLLDSTQDW